MTTELSDAGKLMAELETMTPGEIARRLRGLAVRAICMEPNKCAVAEYLILMIGPHVEPSVGARTWSLWERTPVGERDGGLIERGKIGPNVAEFIELFDNMQWPELTGGEF